MRVLMTIMLVVAALIPCRAQDVVARYGSTTEGICLFEDGNFMLYGYATMVFGKYVINKNEISFTPDNHDKTFEIYASVNNRLENENRFCFVNFEEEPTYFHLTADTMYRLMNVSFNCANGPYVWSANGTVKQIFLGKEDAYLRHFEFEFATAYNDFVLINFPKTRYNQLFSGYFKQMKQVLQIQLEDGTIFAFDKRNTNQDEEWPDLVAYNQMYKTSKSTDTILYANEMFHFENQINLNQYRYDVVNNWYVDYLNLDIAADLENYYPSEFSDVRILRKYEKVQPGVEVDFAKKPVEATQSLFYADCEHTEKGYKYGITYQDKYDPAYAASAHISVAEQDKNESNKNGIFAINNHSEEMGLNEGKLLLEWDGLKQATAYDGNDGSTLLQLTFDDVQSSQLSAIFKAYKNQKVALFVNGEELSSELIVSGLENNSLLLGGVSLYILNECVYFINKNNLR